MRKGTKRSISLMLCVLMILTLIPISSVPAAAEEVTGTAEMNALNALGIDTEEAPEGFDPTSTSNPYGKDHVTVNMVSEVLLTGADKETHAPTTTSAAIDGTPNNKDDKANKTITTVSTKTSYFIQSTLFGDGYKTKGGNVSDLFVTNKKEPKKTVIGTEEVQNITIETTHTSPSAIKVTSSSSITVLEPVDLTVVAASSTARGNFNGNDDGKKAQVVMVSTNKLATDGGLYLAFGEYSDSQDSTYGYFGSPKVILNPSQHIGNGGTTITEDFANNPYLMQNYMKVSAGDYDNDGTDEVAVFVPSKGNSRIEIYKLKTKSLSSDSLEYFGNPSNWEVIWTYPLSEVDYVSNMVSLTSEDFNQDGVDDLAIAWGYYYGPTAKKGGTAAVLFGSESSMLQESTTFPLRYDDTDIVRAAFTYGDVVGDGSGQLVLGGQLNSDIEKNNLNSRFIAVYNWDGTSFKQTMANNYDLYEKTSAGVYKYANIGISGGYNFLSKPYCVSNMAVISSGLSEPAMLYFDSLQFTYGDDGLSLTGALDRKTGAATYFAEYGAQSGDLIGLGYDTLFSMQCELPRFESLSVDPSNFEQWIRYIIFGEKPTTQITIPTATYFNVIDYNKDSTFKLRQKVDHSTSLCLPNTDLDTSVLKYTGVHYFRYTDPKVLAVLASPPYFKDLLGRDDLSGSYSESETTYSSSKGSSDGVIGHASINAGVYASMEQDISVFGVKLGSVEAELAFHAEFTWETQYTTELNQTVEFQTTPGEDTVALYSIPMEIYEYEATMLDSETGEFVTQVMSVNVPHIAAVTVMPVEKYNKIAENFDILDSVDKTILSHTLGDPSSYPTSADGYNDAVVYDGDWSAVGYTSTQAGTSIKQEIEMTSEWENSFELSIGMDYKSGAGMGGVVTGFTIGGEVGVGYVMVSTEGSTFSGTLQSMPSEAEEFGYYHVWKVFYYKYSNGDVEFPVVSYIVTDVSAPSPLPEDFEQNIENTTDKQIALRWSYDKVVSGFQIYRYYEFPEGSGSYELPFVSMKDGVYDSASGKWNFEFIDTGLSPYSDYSYQIQTVRSYVPVRSIKSEVETFSTKSDVGYPQLSLYSTTDPGFNTAEDSLTLSIFPDSTNTVYTTVANKLDYPEGVNYQWQKVENGKWTDVLGKNSNYLTFSGSGESDEGTYRCRTNVIYYDETRGNRYYISSYTESLFAMYSKREPIISDNGFTAGVDAGNIPIISLTLESANMNHRAAPTGSVVFNINGANYSKSYTVELKTGETRYSTAVLDSSIKNAAGLSIATALPEGVYEVTADYSGSRVFKNLSVEDEEAIPLLAGQGGYRLTLKKGSKASTTFTYGDEINGELIQYSKVNEATEAYVVTEGITYTIMEYGNLGSWTNINTNTSGSFKTPGVGKYRMIAALTANDEILATNEFTIIQKPVTVILSGEKTSATGETEQHLPILTLDEGSNLAFEEKLDDLGLYIKYTNTAGNEITMGNTGYSVTSVFNGEKVTQTISRGTPPGSYKATGAAVSYQTNLQKSICVNYSITFVPDTYIITGTKYEVKLTSTPVEGRTAGTLDIISPQVVSSTYGSGTSLTILATPYSGYAVKQWTARVISAAGNTVKTQIEGSTFSYTMKDEPIEVTVEFKIPDNTLTVNSSPAEGGTVTWDDTYFTNGAKVSKNANIVFTAVPTANLYHFVKWQKIYGGLTTDILDQTYSLTMGDYPTMLYAIFERDSYKLTLGNNLTAYYMYDNDGNSKTAMVKKYISSGTQVVGDTLITVEPKVGYQIKPSATWEKDYVDTLYAGSSYSFAMLKDTSIDVETENLSFNVGFKLTEPQDSGNTVAITVNGITTSADKLTGIKGASELVFAAEPAYKYIFKEWKVTVWPLTTDEKISTYSNQVLNIDALGANVNVEAVFIDNTKYVIDTRVNSGSTHGKLCYILNSGAEKDVLNNTVEVYEGDSLKLMAKPDDSYMVDKWYIDGVVWSTPEKEYLLENIDKIHEIKVDFKSKAYYKVDYQVNDTAMGQIITATSDGISFITGNSDLGGGSKLAFKVKPNDGYMVESWTVNNKIIANKYGGNLIENVWSFALGENSAVVVNFAPMKYHTVTKISPNAEIIEDYNFKTTEGNPWDKATGTFTVNPNSGYRITRLYATGSTVSELKQPADKNDNWNMVIGSIINNTTITAETKKIYQIIAFANNGTINCTDNGVEGEEIALTATPISGYKLSEWSVSYLSGADIKKIDVIANKFVMIASDVSVSAVFEKSSDGSTGGGGAAAVPTEIQIEDLQLVDGKVLVTLTDEKNIISEEANLKLIELNKTLDIILEGNEFRIIIPKGALNTGDDVNDIVPEGTLIAGDSWVVSYIDRFGSREVVPWSIFSNGLIAFIAPSGGKYEVINNIQSFGDILGHWGEEQINFTTSRSLFMGTGDNNFSPNMNMNRAMLVTVLYRLDGQKNKKGADFTDIPEGQWYSNAVSWAATNNIVSGYREGLFGPDDSITREQLATILYRYADYLGLNTDLDGNLTGFNDQDRVSDYALEPMSWAVEKGLITGEPGELLSPAGKATRAEVSAILMRFIDMVLK